MKICKKFNDLAYFTFFFLNGLKNFVTLLHDNFINI